MRIIVRPATRWPRILPGLAGFVVLWALVVVCARLYEHHTGSRLDLCLFHRLTGYSCPTCGTTRGLLAMARGDWGQSFAWNPLTMTGGVIGSMAVLGRAITARTLELQLTAVENRILLILGLVLLGLNWAWLIHSHP